MFTNDVPGFTLTHATKSQICSFMRLNVKTGIKRSFKGSKLAAVTIVTRDLCLYKSFDTRALLHCSDALYM